MKELSQAFSFPSLTVCQLHLSFFFAGVGLGPKDSILFRLPLLRRLPFSIRILFYAVVKLLFLFIFSYLIRKGFIFMFDELSRAVAPFYPGGNGGLGGMNGGFNPPPVPDNSAFSAASNDAGPSETETEGRKRERDFISEIKNDKSLCQRYRNALLTREEIIKVMAPLLVEQGIHIEDAEDIRKGVDIYLTETMETTPAYRNRKLRKILKDLTAGREQSKYCYPIIESIEAQTENGPFVPRS